MTWLRVFLMLGVFIVSVQSFPSTTRGNEKESTFKVEAKETTDPTLLQTQNPQTMLDIPTDSEGESSIKFVLKDHKEGLRFQSSLIRDKYTISNLNKKKAEELNLRHLSEVNEIDRFRKNELDKVNNTGESKSEDFPYAETHIKRDQWLFNPQEISSLMGGLPKYFYDAAKPVNPFPELSETIKVAIDSEREKNFPAPIQVKTNQPPQTSGPLLYPQSVFSREIDIPFYI